MHFLVVGDFYIANDAGDFRAQRRQIASDVSIVRHLLDSAAFPGIPVPGDREYHRSGQQHHEQRCSVLLPLRSRLGLLGRVFGSPPLGQEPAYLRPP